MRVFLIAACATLLGCSSELANSPAQAAQPAATENAAAPAPSSAAVPSDSVAVTCGDARATLADGHAVMVAYEDARPPVALAQPTEMEGYVPVGVACTPARTGEAYIAVQYGESGSGCEVCEWVYVYDLQGRQLNHSNPVFLHDASLPPAQQQVPNNSEYTAVAKRLGLAPPSFEFLPDR